jgi:hypothetical protein
MSFAVSDGDLDVITVKSYETGTSSLPSWVDYTALGVFSVSPTVFSVSLGTYSITIELSDAFSANPATIATFNIIVIDPPLPTNVATLV